MEQMDGGVRRIPQMTDNAREKIRLSRQQLQQETGTTEEEPGKGAKKVETIADLQKRLGDI